MRLKSENFSSKFFLPSRSMPFLFDLTNISSCPGTVKSIDIYIPGAVVMKETRCFLLLVS